MNSPEINLASGPRRGSTAKVWWRLAPACHACGFALNALIALGERVRLCGDEFDTLISLCDPPLNAFSLSRSSDLTATLVGPGAMLLKWQRGKGAERYRIFAKILTVDPAPVHVTTVNNLSHTQENLPAGKTVEFFIIAANDAGEAAATAVVSVVVG